MPHVVVFLGPSLEPQAARAILEATYLPPAKRGDLTDAVRNGASVIALIDGVFFQDSAVGHREILAALRQGVRVVGASSMGALRAAEMEVFGMEGVGEIYRRYASGELVADDEVALIFDPYTLAPLSEPLVNIRYALSRAEEAGIIDGQAHGILLDRAAGLFYPDRTYRRICDEAGALLDEATLSRFLSFVDRERPDLKREDAIAALEYLKETLAPS